MKKMLAIMLSVNVMLAMCFTPASAATKWHLVENPSYEFNEYLNLTEHYEYYADEEDLEDLPEDVDTTETQKAAKYSLAKKKVKIKGKKYTFAINASASNYDIAERSTSVVDDTGDKTIVIYDSNTKVGPTTETILFATPKIKGFKKVSTMDYVSDCEEEGDSTEEPSDEYYESASWTLSNSALGSLADIKVKQSKKKIVVTYTISHVEVEETGEINNGVQSQKESVKTTKYKRVVTYKKK